MTLPDFLVLGAARSATTSLHYYLEQHPDLTMSVTKEPNFFAFDHAVDPPTPLFDSPSIQTKSVPERASYERLFSHATPGQRVGEASPLYLYTRETPDQIRRLVPEPRLVAVVREPVDRAYSHWLHIRRDRPEHVIDTFRAACATEMATGGDYSPYAGGTHVLRMGLYDVQIERYVTIFGADALLVLAYEDLVHDPLPSLHRICDHLGVERHAFDVDVQYNRSGVEAGRASLLLKSAIRRSQPTLKRVLPARVVRRLGKLRATYDQPDAPPPVPDDLRAELVEWFRPSVTRLGAEGWADVSRWTDHR